MPLAQPVTSTHMHRSCSGRRALFGTPAHDRQPQRRRHQHVLLRSMNNGSTPPAVAEMPAHAPPRVYDPAQLMAEVRAIASEDFIFEDDASEEEIWDLEHQIKARPATEEARARAADPAANSTPAPPALDPEPSSGADPFAASSAYSPSQGFKEVSVQQVSLWAATQQVGLLLDVRTPQEFAAGHIQGARNVPLEALSQAVRAGELDAHMDGAAGPVAVVCGAGVRSAQAAVRLARVFHFADVVNVAGGMGAWRQAGLHTVEGPE